MKTKLKAFAISVFAVSALILVTSNPLSAEEKNWSLDISSSFYSDYMFRGFNLFDGVSIQPSITASYSLGDYGTLGANFWAHLSGEGATDQQDFTETDETLTYDVSFGDLSLTLGHIWFTFPDSNDGIPDTAEWFASVSYDTVLSPTLSVYHDYREFDAQYYELGLSHGMECSFLGDGFNITPFVNFGFASNAEKVYADSSGLVHVTYGAYFDLELGDIAVTPSLNYTSEVDDATQNEFWVGFSLSYGI